MGRVLNEFSALAGDEQIELLEYRLSDQNVVT